MDPLRSIGVAVESKLVDSAAGKTSELASGGDALDVGAQRSGRLLAVLGEEVGTETSDVGGRHGGAGDGVLFASS